MIRRSILLTGLIVVSLQAASSGAFRDVPSSHWSNVAIYELVSRGITQGYPDGTFRGGRFISRYEVAIFLQKMNDAVNMNNAVSEKLFGELKVELEAAKRDVAFMKRGGRDEAMLIDGNVALRARSGAASSHEGTSLVADYRLRADIKKEVGRDLDATIMIDTLDLGSSGENDRAFPGDIVSVKCRAGISVLGFLGDLEAKTGPGLLLHRDKAHFEAEDFTVYDKPETSVSFSTRYRGNYASIYYSAKNPDDFGETFANEIGLVWGLPKRELPILGAAEITLTPRYLFKDMESSTIETHDLRGEAELKLSPTPKLNFSFLAGGRTNTSDMDINYTRWRLSINDYFNTGTTVKIEFHRAGINYRVYRLDKYDFSLINMFDRLILDGTADLGAELSQKIGESSRIYVKGNTVFDDKMRHGARYEGTSSSIEEGIVFYVPSGMVFSIYYRSYAVPSGIADAADPYMLMRDTSKFSSILSVEMRYDF